MSESSKNVETKVQQVTSTELQKLFTFAPLPLSGTVWFGTVQDAFYFCGSTVKGVPNNCTVPYPFWSSFCWGTTMSQRVPRAPHTPQSVDCKQAKSCVSVVVELLIYHFSRFYVLSDKNVTM